VRWRFECTSSVALRAPCTASNATDETAANLSVCTQSPSMIHSLIGWWNTLLSNPGGIEPLCPQGRC